MVEQIASTYKVDIPSLADSADIVAAFKLYHIGDGGTAGSPTANSITTHLAGKAPLASPAFTGDATFSGNVALGDAISDSIVVNGNVSAASVNVTPTQISYLNTAAGKIGTGNLVFSVNSELTGTTKIADIQLTNSITVANTSSFTNAATFSGSVTLGTSVSNTLTINSKITVAATDVTPTQISYLAKAGGTTGNVNSSLVLSESPVVATPTITGTANLTGTANVNNIVVNGSVTQSATSVLKGAIYGSTATTYTGARRLFVGPTAPDATTYTPVAGDIWMW